MKKLQAFQKFGSNNILRKSAGIAMAAVLLASAVVPAYAETGAASDPDIGYNTNTTTRYTPYDSMTKSDDGKFSVSESSDNSVWKYGVTKTDGKDVFVSASAGFSAPDVAPSQKGFTVSWKKPENAKGLATIHISDGADYTKDFSTNCTSLNIEDVTRGTIYNVQVNYGSVYSAGRVYRNILIGTKVENTSFGAPVINNGSDHAYFYVTVPDAAETLKSQAALMIRVDENMSQDDIVTYDAYSYTESIARHTEDRKGNTLPTYTSDDAWVSFNVDLKKINLKDITNQDGTVTTQYVESSVAPDNISDDKLIYLDDDSGKLYSNKFANRAGFRIFTKDNGKWDTKFRQGYVYIPLSAYSDAQLAEFAETGILRLDFTSLFYYATNNVSGGGALTTNYLRYEYAQNYSEGDPTGQIGRLFDRDISISSISVIPDYSQFLDDYKVDESINSTDYTSVSTKAVDSFYCQTVTPNKNSFDLTLKNDAVSSYYTTQFNRDLRYTTASNEAMSFGFTAPKSGTYEISSPITADVSKGVHYKVTRTSTSGNVSSIVNEKLYAGEKTLCNEIVKLGKGDTVTIDAWADTDATEINLGVPTAICINQADNGALTTSAVDYMQYAKTSGIGGNTPSYNPSSTSECYALAFANTWDFGYFINPITVDDEDGNSTVYDENTWYDITTGGTVSDFDGLKISELTKNSDASAICNKMSTFELTRGGNTYGPKVMCDAAVASGQVAGFGDNPQFIGQMAPRHDSWNMNDSTDIPNKIFAMFGYQATRGSKYMFNVGLYERYTAPDAGNVTVAIPKVNNGTAIILLNNTVYEINPSISAAATLNLTVRKGDKISFIMEKTDGTVSGWKSEIINPTITLTPSTVNVSYEANTTLSSSRVTKGTDIVLPAISTLGSVFIGWRDTAQILYTAGTSVNANEDLNFSPVFAYYADLNGDNIVDSQDIVLLKKKIMGVTDESLSQFSDSTADLNGNGNVDIIDFVRAKKLFADMPVVLGE